MLTLLFSLLQPLQYALNYAIGFGICAVDYGTEWVALTGKTAKCALTHVVPNA